MERAECSGSTKRLPRAARLRRPAGGRSPDKRRRIRGDNVLEIPRTAGGQPCRDLPNARSLDPKDGADRQIIERFVERIVINPQSIEIQLREPTADQTTEGE